MTWFTSYTYTWWQIGVFKLSLLSIGVLIGATWHEFFFANAPAIAAIAVVATAYTMFVSVRQVRHR